VHRHPSDPKQLTKLLFEFNRGEFVLKKGRGQGIVHCGKIARLEVPDLKRRRIIIYPAFMYSRRIGCDAFDLRMNRWDEVHAQPEKIEFDYSWFYRQPRHARLKLEFVPKADEEAKSRVRRFFSWGPVITDRCWLCSSEDPMYVDLFRTMLFQMLLAEQPQRESKLKALRNRLFS